RLQALPGEVRRPGGGHREAPEGGRAPPRRPVQPAEGAGGLPRQPQRRLTHSGRGVEGRDRLPDLSWPSPALLAPLRGPGAGGGGGGGAGGPARPPQAESRREPSGAGSPGPGPHVLQPRGPSNSDGSPRGSTQPGPSWRALLTNGPTARGASASSGAGRSRGT